MGGSRLRRKPGHFAVLLLSPAFAGLKLSYFWNLGLRPRLYARDCSAG